MAGRPKTRARRRNPGLDDYRDRYEVERAAHDAEREREAPWLKRGNDLHRLAEQSHRAAYRVAALLTGVERQKAYQAADALYNLQREYAAKALSDDYVAAKRANRRKPSRRR